MAGDVFGGVNSTRRTYATGNIPFTGEDKEVGFGKMSATEVSEMGIIESILTKAKTVWDRAVDKITFSREAFKAISATTTGFIVSRLIESYNED